MDLRQDTSPCDVHCTSEGNLFLMNQIQVLDEEKESILSEVLKCTICLEFPKGKQVRICEKGHHFCQTCHQKMNSCGICRGKLLESRNFAVEELVMKLVSALEISKNELPAPQAPAKYTRGSYRCPHSCPAKTPAHLMLPHLRAKHRADLIDNVRSNPYSGRFSFVFRIPFVRDLVHTLSAHVSDMGLFIVEVRLKGFDFLGWARALGDKSLSSQFKYQMLVRIPAADNHFDFSVGDCDVASFQDGEDSILARGNLLKIQKADLSERLAEGGRLIVFFSLWRKSEKKKSEILSSTCVPEKNLFLASDRRTRRNRNRNARSKKLREKLRALKVAENGPRNLAEDLSSGLQGLSPDVPHSGRDTRSDERRGASRVMAILPPTTHDKLLLKFFI